jgi:hypothetical protein
LSIHALLQLGPLVSIFSHLHGELVNAVLELTPHQGQLVMEEAAVRSFIWAATLHALILISHSTGCTWQTILSNDRCISQLQKAGCMCEPCACGEQLIQAPA